MVLNYPLSPGWRADRTMHDCGGGEAGDSPPLKPRHWSKRIKSLEKFPPRNLPSLSAPPAPDPMESFPRPRAGAGGAGGRRGPGRMGAGSHWRSVRSVLGTPFQSNGPGTEAAVGRRRPGRGSCSPPKFSSAIRCRVAASTRFPSSCFFFFSPPSLSPLSFSP